MKRIRQMQALSIIAVLAILGLAASVNGLPSGGFPIPASIGFGSTCLNRHDASIRNVYVFNAVVNYTGAGESLVVGSDPSTVQGNQAGTSGYIVDIWLNVDPAIMMNQQADTTNGSVFVRDDAFGVVHKRCVYNILPTQTYLIVEEHLTNVTAYHDGMTQLVTWSTGTHFGQYNVTWLGP
jgi:hypothetical protein